MPAPDTTLIPGKARVEWVDSARCLAMFFIMWLHVGSSPAWVARPVGGGICLFFVLAGYFMSSEPCKAIRRTLKLGLAWLLWSLITLGLSLALDPHMEWTWAKVFGIGQSAYNTPLWFLKNLTLYQLIIIGLTAVRILPRYNWLILVMLAGFSYIDEPAQHEGLRFDWMMAVMLGYCLKSVPLTRLEEWLQKNFLCVVAVAIIILLQRDLYPALLQNEGLKFYKCSLRISTLCYAVLICQGAMLLSRYLPRANKWLAVAGSCMMFTYASHHIFYAPIYAFEFPKEYGAFYSAASIALLTALYHFLARFFPRSMKTLTAG